MDKKYGSSRPTLSKPGDALRAWRETRTQNKPGAPRVPPEEMKIQLLSALNHLQWKYDLPIGDFLKQNATKEEIEELVIFLEKITQSLKAAL